jgi:CheY-like chemotaxis protein
LPSCDGASAEEPPESEPAARGTERILFVDDEEVVARAAQDLLETLGYKVTACRDGVEALETFAADPDAFDLALLDQVMPRMTGAELARRLLVQRPRLPIIICTAYSETLTPELADSIGIRRCLTKSLGLRAYARAVREVLDETAKQTIVANRGVLPRPPST